MTDLSQLVFIDTETTGLDVRRHQIWELALIDGESGERHLWHLPIDQSKADLIALNIGKWADRYREEISAVWVVEDKVGSDDHTEDMLDFLYHVQTITWGKHLVGAIPSFDEQFLRKLMLDNGIVPGWHYHLIDIEALSVGYLSRLGHAFEPPWKSDDLSDALGVDIDPEKKHTAMGDALWARDMYLKVMSGLAPIDGVIQLPDVRSLVDVDRVVEESVIVRDDLL